MAHKKKRRSSAKILRDILYVARNGKKKTHILFGSNLNLTMLEKYIRLAMDAGLLERTEKLYITTQKGEDFIKSYDLYQNLLQDLEQLERQIEKLLSK